MVKHKDQLVEKELQTPIKNPESIKSAKETLKDKLDKAAQEKIQKEEQQKQQQQKLAEQKEKEDFQRLSSMSEDERRNQMVSDIIDEMDKEQGTKKFGSTGSIALKQVDDDVTAGIPEDSGFIKKYTDK